MSETACLPWITPPPRLDELVTDDGEPMDSERHRRQMELLIETLELAWQDRQDFYVGGNMFFYYSELQTRKHDFRGPDVLVVLDTERRERKAWVTWLEDGKRPDLIIELTSESTASEDHGPKKRLYERVLGIPGYFIYDPFSAELEGYELGRQGLYVPLPPDAAGRLPAPRLGLWLGVWDGEYRGLRAPWLRWFTPAGELLPSGEERLAVANQQAEAASRQAKAASRQAKAANRQAKAASRQAEEASRQAEAERAARQRLEAELAQLRAQLAGQTKPRATTP